MILLTFAHRGEAQTFLKEMKLKAAKGATGLYLGHDHALLITGEGEHETLMSISSALPLIPEVRTIVNLGICGCIDNSVAIGDILRVRTAYHEDEFKSFETLSSFSHDNVDIITTKKRILEQEVAKKLSVNASLVDREAWANGYCAKHFHKDFIAIKLISDQVSEAKICELIKDQAEDFSDKLYEYYQKLSIGNSISEIGHHDIFNDPNFYFTVALRRFFHQLIESLKQKQQRDESEILNPLCHKLLEHENFTAKHRAKILIEHLNEELYPFKTQVNKKLNELSVDLNKYDVHVKYDKDLERKGFHISAYIDGDSKKLLVSKAIEKYPWHKFVDIMDGK
jgi:nucleoside phosphorylase